MNNRTRSIDRKKVQQILFDRCVTELETLIELGMSTAPDLAQIKDILDAQQGLMNQKLSIQELPLISESEKQEVAYRLKVRGTRVRPQDETIVLSGGRVPPWIDSSEVEWRFWGNYKEQLKAEGKSASIITEHEIAIDRILNLSGNPLDRTLGTRKGLVMGNVQSGKTLNFVGLINKALDAGYHTIVVLGGHMNELRSQAQARINAGVIDVHAMGNSPLHQIDNIPHALTTIDDDFHSSKASGQSMNLFVTPAIYVVKKMPTMIENLITWFGDKNHGYSALSKPLLLIDDEADYASINTLYQKNQTTSTNKQIRALLSLFQRGTYVAYTATPFANVFIPFKDDKLDSELDDLFPSDFMIKMPIPPEYCGQDFFFRDEEENLESPCRFLDEESHHKWLDIKHKKTAVLNTLHEELIEAVYAFLCVIAIRHLRGQINQHNTMLVNVSRFNIVQETLGLLILELVQTIQTQIRAFGALGESAACAQSKHLASLKLIFNREFSQSGESFSDVLNTLSTESQKRFVSVEVVNGDVKKNKNSPKLLDYDSHSESGLWVIAVGGLKLSRGLTLEGLAISYFYRNALAYDTLTQMCRWFGYRPRYQDLCRLYLLETSYTHYISVADSIRQLYRDLEVMSLSNGTPRDYGLRVKNSEPALLITAKNKLGTAKRIQFTYRLWGESIDALRPKLDDKLNDENYELTRRLLAKCKGIRSPVKSNGSWIFESLEYDDVTNFLTRMKIGYADKRIQIAPVVDALNALREHKFPRPKLVLFSRIEGKRHKDIDITTTLDGDPADPIGIHNIEGLELKMITKSMKSNDDGQMYVPSKSISDSDDLKCLLTPEEQQGLAQKYSNGFQNLHIREELLSSPVLVVYLFRSLLTKPDSGQKYIAHSRPTVAFSIHFPADRNHSTRISEMDTNAEYLINEVLQNANQDDISDEDETHGSTSN